MAFSKLNLCEADEHRFKGLREMQRIFAVAMGAIRVMVLGMLCSNPSEAGTIAAPVALQRGPTLALAAMQSRKRPEVTYWSTGTWITAYPSYYQFDGQGTVEGMATDSSGNLYVANSATDEIYVYPPGGSSSPIRTLADPGEAPMSVAVCPDGTVYVANRTPEYGVPLVTVYSAGAVSPTSTFTQQNASQVWSVACDRLSNIYASWTASAAPSPQFIVKYAPGGLSGEVLKAAPNSSMFMIDFVVDSKGVLGMLVYNQSTGQGEIDFIAPDKLKPERVIGGLDNPNQLAFDANSEDFIWVTQTFYCQPLQTPYPQVVEYSRSGHQVLNLAQQFQTYGIASGSLPK